MNWQAISFDWNQVRTFLAIAEEGSLSGAARVLKTTQPTVGRQISALEEALGVTLFERTVRGLTLTDAGLDLIAYVRSMGEAATLISLVAAGRSQEVAGEISVTAADLIAAKILSPFLSELRTLAPGIQVQVIAANEVQNLVQREADIAIRHVRPEQPDLIARHVADLGANLYAASDYLDRVGRPRYPSELAEHAFVGSPNSDRLANILKSKGIDLRPENIVLRSASGVVIWEAVKAGVGVTMLPDVLAEKEHGLEKVLQGFPSIEFPLWLVTHRELRTSQRVRVVFDFLARRIQEI